MSSLATFRSSSSGTSVALPASDAGWGDTRNDEFRLIKWHFLSNLEALHSSGRNPRIILITSAREGEGKSYVAHHLAANFALDPHLNLTLIDANPEHPALGTSSWMGGSSGGPGLFDYLDGAVDQSSIVRSTGLSNVKVILSGQARDSAPELLAIDRMSELLASLVAGGNSFVIIDAGPVLKNGGAAVLARHAGQIGYVVACNSTRRADATQGLAILDRIAGPIDEKSLGLILN
jgi:receptor protein-tyrosine kinase